MNDNGWVKVYRKIMAKGYYKKSQYVHLWLHLLLKASHNETEFMWNGKIEKLQPGQFVTGRNSLSSDTGIPASTVEDILNLFEIEQQIRQQKNNKFRLLTVINWDGHQEIRQQKQQQGDIQPTSTQQQADTFKNEKNVRIKEIKNIPPSMEELKSYIQEKKYGIDAERFMAYYDSNGWMVGKNKMKNWKAALVTWQRSGFNTNKKPSTNQVGSGREELKLTEKQECEREIVREKAKIEAYKSQRADRELTKLENDTIYNMMKYLEELEKYYAEAK